MSAQPIRVPHTYRLKTTWKNWRISGCTIHDSTDKDKYCMNSCRIREHCTVYIAIMNEKEKVEFT